jgi:hypothetical protein
MGLKNKNIYFGKLELLDIKFINENYNQHQKPVFEYGFIDGNYFAITLINRLDMNNYEESFTTFIDNKVNQNGVMVKNMCVVFDNLKARLLCKVPTLINRYSNIKSGPYKTPINIDKMRSCFKKFNIEVIESRFDADSEICKLLGSKTVGKTVLKVENSEEIEASNICVFSGDSDFCSFFPTINSCVIMNCDLNLNLIVCNYNTIYNPTIYELFQTNKMLLNISLICSTMLSPNDFLTCSFLNLQVLTSSLLLCQNTSTIQNVCTQYVILTYFSLLFTPKGAVNRAILNNAFRLLCWNKFDNSNSKNDFFIKYVFKPSQIHTVGVWDELKFITRMFENINFFCDNVEDIKHLERECKTLMQTCSVIYIDVTKIITSILDANENPTKENENLRILGACSLAYLTIVIPCIWTRKPFLSEIHFKLEILLIRILSQFNLAKSFDDENFLFTKFTIALINYMNELYS